MPTLEELKVTDHKLRTDLQRLFKSEVDRESRIEELTDEIERLAKQMKHLEVVNVSGPVPSSTASEQPVTECEERAMLLCRIAEKDGYIQIILLMNFQSKNEVEAAGIKVSAMIEGLEQHLSFVIENDMMRVYAIRLTKTPNLSLRVEAVCADGRHCRNSPWSSQANVRMIAERNAVHVKAEPIALIPDKVLAEREWVPKDVSSRHTAPLRPLPDSPQLVGLPELDVNKPRCSLSAISRAGLRGRCVFTSAKMLNRPIGCSFDAATERFLFCNTLENKLKSLDATTGKWCDLDVAGLDNPSALAMYETGRSFLVKDDCGVVMCDLRSPSTRRIIDQLKGPMGVGVTNDGRIVTIGNARHACPKTTVLMVDIRQASQAVDQFPFRPREQALKPYFLDVYDDEMVVTDLGVNRVFKFDLKAKCYLGCIGELGGYNGQFRFVSGVRFDREKQMLIADAKGRLQTIQRFNEAGDFLSVVKLDRHPGFVSDIHVTPSGQLATMCRNTGEIHIYELEASR